MLKGHRHSRTCLGAASGGGVLEGEQAGPGSGTLQAASGRAKEQTPPAGAVLAQGHFSRSPRDRGTGIWGHPPTSWTGPHRPGPNPRPFHDNGFFHPDLWPEGQKR